MSDAATPATGEPLLLSAALGAVRLVLHPVASRPGVYSAVPGSHELCRSRQPFYDAARGLLGRGVPADTALEARHQGSAIVAMRGTVGELARLAVEESDRHGLKLRRYRPPEEKGLKAPPGGGVGSENARGALPRVPTPPARHPRVSGPCATPAAAPQPPLAAAA